MTEPAHQDLHDDLKTTSESVSVTADRIKQLEDEKRALDPGDPRVLELSTTIEKLAAGLQHQVAIEKELAVHLEGSE